MLIHLRLQGRKFRLLAEKLLYIYLVDQLFQPYNHMIVRLQDEADFIIAAGKVERLQLAPFHQLHLFLKLSERAAHQEI